MSWTALLVLAAAVAVFYLVCWFVDLIDRVRSLERLASTLGNLREKFMQLEDRLAALETAALSEPNGRPDAAHCSAAER